MWPCNTSTRSHPYTFESNDQPPFHLFISIFYYPQKSVRKFLRGICVHITWENAVDLSDGIKSIAA